jgi:hypothetical protein
MIDRSIPLSTRLAVLFGGAHQQFGWAFFSFGMLFTLIFVPVTDLSFVTFRGEMQTAPAVVTDVTETRYSEGGGKGRRGTRVMEVHYRWTDPAGAERQASSFDVRNNLEVGDTANVEYLVADPERSRLVGLRRAPITALALLVLIFPAAGLGLTMWGRHKARQQLRLLEHGQLLDALVLSVDSRKYGKRQRQYTLSLRVPAEGDPHDIVGHVTLDASAAAVGARVQVLMHRALGERAERMQLCLLREIATHPRISSDGAQVEPTSAGRVALRMALPTLLCTALLVYMLLG